MVFSERSYWVLTEADLTQLRQLAHEEHEEFFRRNPRLGAFFRKSLIGICLCQGAASHYLHPAIGIKDFDIWHFYRENKDSSFPYRAHKSIEGGYRGKRIDFLKRAIPESTCEQYPGQPGRTILSYLHQRDTRTKAELLKKAIIGLWPSSILGETLWKGQQAK